MPFAQSLPGPGCRCLGLWSPHYALLPPAIASPEPMDIVMRVASLSLVVTPWPHQQLHLQRGSRTCWLFPPRMGSQPRLVHHYLLPELVRQSPATSPAPGFPASQSPHVCAPEGGCEHQSQLRALDCGEPSCDSTSFRVQARVLTMAHKPKRSAPVTSLLWLLPPSLSRSVPI